MIGRWRHVVPVILYQHGATGEVPWDCTPALARLVTARRVVVTAAVVPPLGVRVALHFACSNFNDGALVLVGMVRTKYNFRLGGAAVQAFAIAVQEVIDEPGLITLLGPERVPTVAH